MLLNDVSDVFWLTTLAAIILSYGKGNEFVCPEVNHGIHMIPIRFHGWYSHYHHMTSWTHISNVSWDG